MRASTDTTIALVRLTIRMGISMALSAAGAPGFAQGGAFMVGGNGGTDSQLVTFRATPGERVSIQTPQQQQNQGNGNNSPVFKSGSTHVHNYMDDKMFGAYISTPQGSRHIHNVIRRDRAALRSTLGIG